MSWLDQWLRSFGADPMDPTSREVCVQEVLAELIAGQRCAWFKSYSPTDQGRAFLASLWREAFSEGAPPISWFVSEYELPVPPAWREEIPFTYRCPDFACGDADRVLIVELKTERGSYSARQMADYLRLARHRLPQASTDVVLLGPHAPGAQPDHDARQRYAELTWTQVPALLAATFPGVPRAEQLSDFLGADLAMHAARASRPTQDPPQDPVTTTAPEEDVEQVERCAAAVLHALRMAPSLVAADSHRLERGIDVAFPSVAAAREGKASVAAALRDASVGELVSVWLWQPSSTGRPTTEAGAETGVELRLAPRRGKHNPSS